MTAEVVIMNKYAVALAADSAVTISESSMQKVYYSAHKIYALPRHYKIGIMLFGNPEFMGIPWEIIIDLYGKDLIDEKEKKTKVFTSVDECANNFIQFLRDFEINAAEVILPNYFNLNLDNYVSNIQSVTDRDINAREIESTNLKGVYNSGIVIVGFGSESLFPAFKSYMIKSYLLRKTEIKEYKSYKVSIGHEVSIEPFAMEEIINMFLYGISSDYKKVFSGFLAWTLDSYYQKLKRMFSLTNKQQEELREFAKSFLLEVEKDMPKYSRIKHHNPIRNAVALLPKKELAVFAESLIKLTSLHLKFSNEQETVGGPIDVAIISKADGFTWVQKKGW